MTRPAVVRIAIGVLLMMGAGALLWRLQPRPLEMVVYKTASCLCCLKWLSGLPASSFKVSIELVDDMAMQQEALGIPPELSSCHTAVVDGYIIEGHVPLEDIRRLLKERPKVKGLFLPGMPTGSPGMEGPGGRPYTVLSVDAEGRKAVFATHQPRDVAESKIR